MKTKILVLMIALCLVFAQSLSADAKTIKKGFTGEEIFTGVVFGQGKVAKLFPELWTKEMLKEAKSKEAKEFSSKVISEIKIIQPTYMDEFKAAVDSKNYVLIDEVLNDGALLFEQAIGNLGLEIKHNEVTGQWLYAAAVVAVVLAGAGMYIATAHTAITAVQVYLQAGYWSSQDSEISLLEKEIFISNIIDRLSTN